jgi:hypothetical protein
MGDLRGEQAGSEVEKYQFGRGNGASVGGLGRKRRDRKCDPTRYYNAFT